MTFIESFQKELDREAITTRKMLERVPEANYDWKPHEKSMTLRQLATHVAEIPNWMVMILNTTEFDFGKNEYKQAEIKNGHELIGYFERSLADGRTAISGAKDEQLGEIWTMRNGEQVYAADPKEEALRGCFCQVVHHRAQLGVYLRLLNVPIPGSYGPSADDSMGF